MTAAPRHAGHGPLLPRRRRRLAGYAAVSAVTLLAAGLVSTRLGHAGPACRPGTPALAVAAAPDIAAVVGEVARRYAGTAGCGGIVVSAPGTGEVLDAFTRGTTRPPDVWIPHSSVLLRRPGVAGLAPDDAPSIATSPLVLAVTPGLADRLRPGAGRPGAGRPDLTDVVDAATGTRPVALRLPDRRHSAATPGAVLSLEAAVADRRSGRAALAGMLRSARLDDAVGQPGAPAVTGDLAVPVSEQAVWAGGAAAAIAVYPRPARFVFDYPYAVRTLDPQLLRTAASLLAALRGAAGQDLLRAAGFRDVQGRAGAALTGRPQVDGTHAVGAVDVPGPAALARVDRLIDTVQRDARLLAVLDVSGSMGQPVAGLAGVSRLDLAKRAAAEGLALYPDSTEIGLWVFATRLSGAADHREVAAVAPLAAGAPDAGGEPGARGVRGADGVPVAGGRARLARALAGVRHLPGGNTGLYDTTLAAVRAMRRQWRPERVNAVVLLTDGANADDHGITLNQLLGTLRRENDPHRPVPVITIGYGPDSDARVLARISRATGGAAYVARDPRGIREIFLDALGQRTCRPACR